MRQNHFHIEDLPVFGFFLQVFVSVLLYYIKGQNRLNLEVSLVNINLQVADTIFVGGHFLSGGKGADKYRPFQNISHCFRLHPLFPFCFCMRRLTYILQNS